jgi:hypothetical protein
MAARTRTPTPVTLKAKMCAVNRERWSRLIPDQPDCTKPIAKPTSALCARHEKMLPDGWRKLEAERSRAKDAKPKAQPKKERVSAKARNDVYTAIVARPEAEGATTSDAQGAADVEVHNRGLCDPKNCSLHRISGRTFSKPPISDGL